MAFRPDGMRSPNGSPFQSESRATNQYKGYSVPPWQPGLPPHGESALDRLAFTAAGIDPYGPLRHRQGLATGRLDRSRHDFRQSRIGWRQRRVEIESLAKKAARGGGSGQP